MIISVLLLLSTRWTTAAASSLIVAPNTTATDDSGRYAANSKEYKLERISKYLECVRNGTYPGDLRTNSRGRPLYTQRTSLLFYQRKHVGDPLAWMTLALGVVKNGRELVSDKKTSVQRWKAEDPYLFSKLEEHMPRTWTDLESFGRDMDEDKIYVYKPSDMSGGEGLRFQKGSEVSKFVTELENTSGGSSSEWVIQAFVDPFLYEGRKTHLRALTLMIVQPSGEHEFFQFSVMKIFAAVEPYDEQRLIHDSDDIANMVVTNLRQSMTWFEEHKTEGMVFDGSKYVLNAKEVFEASGSGIEFEAVYEEVKSIHETLYSMMGHLFSCKGTDVSIYDDACFRLIASDFALDEGGTPYLLEGNMAMGLRDVWTRNEISNFSNGAAALIKAPLTPFNVPKSPVWDKINTFM